MKVLATQGGKHLTKGSKTKDYAGLFRNEREPKLFEIYYLEEATMIMRLKENVELYVDPDFIFDDDNLGRSQLCEQKKFFEIMKDDQERPSRRAVVVEPSFKFQLHKTLSAQSISQVPYNLFKDMVLKILIEYFNEDCKVVFPYASLNVRNT